MAKSSKNDKDQKPSDTVEVEAPEVAEVASDSEGSDASDNGDVKMTQDEVEFTHNEAEETLNAVEELADDSVSEVSDPDSDMEVVEEASSSEPSEPEEIPEVVAPQSQPVPEQRSGGFVPLLVGGLVAGAIGYGVATYYPQTSSNSEELTAQLAEQADRVAALEEALAEPAEELDLSGFESQIAALEARAEATESQLSDQLSALDARLIEVEKQPGSDGTLSDTALAAYQRELEQLRSELDAQKEDVMSAAAQAEADLAAARAEAERLEQEAAAEAEAAVARAALNRIATAVDTGSPFADAMTALSDADIPAALSDAAGTGVATTAELTSDFPAVARAALATARAEGVSDDAGGLGGFLRNQFDVRSTTPQEGSGPDAVLSRAEAAVKEGRIADALAELDGLPEVARAEITDWSSKAQERADVLDALAVLTETYN